MNTPLIAILMALMAMGVRPMPSLVRLYGDDGRRSPARKYGPSECSGARARMIEGRSGRGHVPTGQAEYRNLTVRMSMRRFMRLTSAFGRKVGGCIHMPGLCFVHSSHVRNHSPLRVTPGNGGRPDGYAA